MFIDKINGLSGEKRIGVVRGFAGGEGTAPDSSSPPCVSGSLSRYHIAGICCLFIPDGCKTAQEQCGGQEYAWKKSVMSHK